MFDQNFFWPKFSMENMTFCQNSIDFWAKFEILVEIWLKIVQINGFFITSKTWELKWNSQYFCS